MNLINFVRYMWNELSEKTRDNIGKVLAAIVGIPCAFLYVLSLIVLETNLFGTMEISTNLLRFSIIWFWGWSIFSVCVWSWDESVAFLVYIAGIAHSWQEFKQSDEYISPSRKRKNKHVEHVEQDDM